MLNLAPSIQIDITPPAPPALGVASINASASSPDGAASLGFQGVYAQAAQPMQVDPVKPQEPGRAAAVQSSTPPSSCASPVASRKHAEQGRVATGEKQQGSEAPASVVVTPTAPVVPAPGVSAVSPVVPSGDSTSAAAGATAAAGLDAGGKGLLEAHDASQAAPGLHSPAADGSSQSGPDQDAAGQNLSSGLDSSVEGTTGEPLLPLKSLSNLDTVHGAIGTGTPSSMDGVGPEGPGSNATASSKGHGNEKGSKDGKDSSHGRGAEQGLPASALAAADRLLKHSLHPESAADSGTARGVVPAPLVSASAAQGALLRESGGSGQIGTAAGQQASTGRDAGSSEAATSSEAAGAGADSAAAMQGVQSARLLQTLNSSEMRVGLHSAEFGSISIQASLTRDQMAAQISVEHGGLGRVLASHLPEMETNLDRNHGMNAHIGVQSHSQGSGAGQSKRDEGRGQDGARGTGLEASSRQRVSPIGTSQIDSQFGAGASSAASASRPDPDPGTGDHSSTPQSGPLSLGRSVRGGFRPEVRLDIRI